MYKRTTRIRAHNGEGCYTADGYKVLTVDGKQRMEHILIAEKALGKPLPPSAKVHHMNGNKTDNYSPFNLIVCPNQSYHMLLHARSKMLGHFPEAWMPGRSGSPAKNKTRTDVSHITLDDLLNGRRG